MKVGNYCQYMKEVDEKKSWKNFLKGIAKRGKSINDMKRKMKKVGFDRYIQTIFKQGHLRGCIETTDYINKYYDLKPKGEG